MKENDKRRKLTKIRTYILEKEELPLFYSLLPKKHCKADIDEEYVFLGAVGTVESGESYACGVMIVRIVRKNMMVIQWILVAPQYQKQGVGNALMDLAREICSHLNLQMVGNFSQKTEEGKEGEIYRFMHQNEFVIYPEGARSYVTNLGEVGKGAFFKKDMKSSGSMILEKASASMIMRFNQKLREKGQLFIPPISKENVLGDISLVVVKQEEIQACVIFRELGEKEIELAFVYTDSKGSIQVPLLLIQSYRLLREKYSPETVLVIPCVTEASGKMVETLVPAARVERIAYSIRWIPEKC